MEGKNDKAAKFVERRDETYLADTVFDTDYCDELKSNDKHEIVVMISDILGSSPENLKIAEEIFEKIKFETARYILHHEYSREKKDGIRSNLLIWLDSKINPEDAAQVSNFFGKYIK